MNKIEEAAVDFIKRKINGNYEIAIILGSGLGNFADIIENKKILEYKDIPGFSASTVKGHDGKLIFGEINNKKIVALKGRIHYYEGLGIDQVVFPIKILSQLGIKKLIVTNAAGGVNKSFKATDLMLITDHINFAGINPLVGPNDENGPRFPDMTYAYDRKLQELAKKTAKDINIDLKEGIYMFFTGPSYETPAEVRMAKICGADAVGMSTVPEVIVARHRDINVLGISCITNMAAGLINKSLDHEEVVKSASIVEEKFQKLISGIIKNI